MLSLFQCLSGRNICANVGLRSLTITANKTSLPNYFRFQTDVPIDAQLDNKRLLEFSRHTSSGSQLATKLFDHDSVRMVLLGRDMVVLRLAQREDFDTLANPIKSDITSFLESGASAIEHPKQPDDGLKDLTIPVPDPIEGVPLHMVHLQKVLDVAIRPTLRADRGDLDIVDFTPLEDDSVDEVTGYPRGVLYVRLQGACAGCPHSKQTMRGFVANVVGRYLPNVVDVIDVDA
ncbi:Nfu1 [Carpediemonas membranifera]|uniref:Nfu1 n=1 Tax=Carpediemonas membranifera TaxID=201153 RepID=A0A8J6BCL3_9EUKA|nr:Nfu1 [Carpediemonas membranifera]|eukprot:KAG9394632.1 Nfu1 [Carpediemonas membranifera]